MQSGIMIHKSQPSESGSCLVSCWWVSLFISCEASVSRMCLFHTCFFMSLLAAVEVEWWPHTVQLQPFTSLCMCCSNAISMPPGQNKKETINSKDVFFVFDEDWFHICSAVAMQSAMWWVTIWRLTWDFGAVLMEW